MGILPLVYKKNCRGVNHFDSIDMWVLNHFDSSDFGVFTIIGIFFLEYILYSELGGFYFGC